MTEQSPGAAATGTIRVASAAATHIGHVRTTNEDSYLDADPVFLVADGMGGHNAGEVASAIAVEEFEKLTVQDGVTVELLGDALASAAQRIGALGDEEQMGAGTTVAVVATMVLDDVGYWAVMNLGDSRVYRLSEDVFEQVSVDHSVVQELMDRGELTPEQARFHPYRHMITRALGAGPSAEPDYWLIPAETGDRMLICSDGLTGEVPDVVIERVLRSPGSVQDACQNLVRLALDAGGRDNVTVLVLEATEIVGLSTPPEESTLPPQTPSTADDIEEDTVPRGVAEQTGGQR